MSAKIQYPPSAPRSFCAHPLFEEILGKKSNFMVKKYKFWSKIEVQVKN